MATFSNAHGIASAHCVIHLLKMSVSLISKNHVDFGIALGFLSDGDCGDVTFVARTRRYDE